MKIFVFRLVLTFLSAFLAMQSENIQYSIFQLNIPALFTGLLQFQDLSHKRGLCSCPGCNQGRMQTVSYEYENINTKIRKYKNQPIPKTTMKEI